MQTPLSSQPDPSQPPSLSASTASLTIPSSHSPPPLIQRFFNLPIRRKTQLMTALIFVALGGLVAWDLTALVRNLRSQGLNQTKSQLAVTELNYNSDLEAMSLGFAAQAENPTIIEVAKKRRQGETLTPETREQLNAILTSERQIRQLEYATLVGTDLRIIANSHENRTGEVFNPQNLVKKAIAQKQQIRTSELVRWEELTKEQAALPEGLTNQDALIRYTITPVKLPGTQTVIGTLVAGDIVNGHGDIVQKTVETFQGIGYSAIYLYHRETQEFNLATAYEKTELRRAKSNVPLEDASILQTAIEAKGQTVSWRSALNSHTYTFAAKAIPNDEGEPVAVLVYGDPEFALNRIIRQSFSRQLGLSVAILSVVMVLAAVITQALTKPIKRLQQVTQKFANGDYQARAKITAQDEIGQLAERFNDMAHNIAANEEHLRQHNKMLGFLGELSPPHTLNSADLDPWFQQGLDNARELIGVDRLLLYRLDFEGQGTISHESVASPKFSLLDQNVDNKIIPPDLSQQCSPTSLGLMDDLSDIPSDFGYQAQLNRLNIKAYLIVPIFNRGHSFGFIMAHHCANAHHWQKTEIDFLKQLVTQWQVTLERVTLAERESLEARLSGSLKEITRQIAQAFHAEDLFDLIVEGSRQGIKADRVIIYSFDQSWRGTIIAESVNPIYPRSFGLQISDPCFAESYVEKYRQGRVQATANIYNAGLSDCHLQQLAPLQVQANLVVPIVVSGELLGLLIAHHCQSPRHWQQPEIDFLTQVALQIGVALERANLLDEQTLAKEQQRQAKEKLQQHALELLMQVEPIRHGDLTVRAQVTEDEIGTVADSYNATVENLRRIVGQVQSASQQFSTLTEGNERLIDTLSTEALRQVEQTAIAGDRLAAMTHSINLVAQNAEETLLAAQQANQSVVRGENAMNQTVTGMIAIKETVTETARKINQLGEASQEISKVVSLIGRFAAQTHLLALKASIEAALAGEEGRGFAVIADEVRTLATSSAEATAEIETLVNSIQSGTQEVAQTMETGTQQVLMGTQLVEETRNSLNQITATTQQINRLVTSISQATQEQSVSTEAMNTVMAEITTMAEQTSTAASSLSHSFQEVLSVAQQLQSGVEQFKVR